MMRNLKKNFCYENKRNFFVTEKKTKILKKFDFKTKTFTTTTKIFHAFQSMKAYCNVRHSIVIH